MRIVEFEKRYLEQLRRLFLTERKNTFTWLDTDSFYLLDFDHETEDENIWVALESETVIGFISVWPEDNFIHHLYVASSHRRRGAGTALLNAVLETMRSPLTLKCLELNANAMRFYSNHGFIKIGHGQSEHGNYLLMKHDEVILSSSIPK